MGRPSRAACALLFLAACSGDPSYKSKSAAEWRELLKSPDPQLRAQAATAFKEAPPHTYATVLALLQTANDADPVIADMSRSALRELGEDATGALVQALDAVSPPVRRRAAEALGGVKAPSKKVVGSLIDRMQDSDDSVRTLAVISLGRIGAPAASAREPIHLLATTPGPQRAAALFALPNVDTEAHTFLAIYAEAARDTSESVRIAAIKNLLAGARGPEHDVVPIVRSALADPSDSVKILGLGVARLLGSVAREVLPDIVNLKRAANPSVRLAADSAAFRIGGVPLK